MMFHLSALLGAASGLMPIPMLHLLPLLHGDRDERPGHRAQQELGGVDLHLGQHVRRQLVRALRAELSVLKVKELRKRVLTTYHAECATSPHASDSKRKRLAPHVYITAQALIVMSGLQSIYDSHLRRFPRDKGKVSFAGFKDMKPWYAIFGDRQTCLCKHCENFLCYQDALRVAATFLATMLIADPAAA